MVCQRVVWHRVAMVCMAANRDMRWSALADGYGGNVVRRYWREIL